MNKYHNPLIGFLDSFSEDEKIPLLCKKGIKINAEQYIPSEGGHRRPVEIEVCYFKKSEFSINQQYYESLKYQAKEQPQGFVNDIPVSQNRLIYPFQYSMEVKSG